MNFSWQNVIDANGIGITITGMLIVFTGLLLISLFIAALPRVLKWQEQSAVPAKASKKLVPEVAESEPSESEIMAIISLVLHMELERSLGENGRLTITRQQRNGSIWSSAGKMRSLSEGGSHA